MCIVNETILIMNNVLVPVLIIVYDVVLDYRCYAIFCNLINNLERLFHVSQASKYRVLEKNIPDIRR